jgi:RND family efflux transporter MFP subunit
VSASARLLPALGAIALVAVALPSGIACHRASVESLETANPVPVQVAVARRGTLRGVVRAAGVVTPAPGAELVVIAPAPSRVAAIPHGEGERVAKGDVLVRFEAPALEADVAGKRADLARGETHVRTAAAELERLTALEARGIAARKEVDAARRDVADAQAEVATSRAALAASSTMAGRDTVRAPFDGVIAARLHNPGDLVDAATGDPVLRLVDPARLQVEAAVPLADLATVAVGQPARVLGADGALVASGTVVARPAAADPATAGGKVRIGLAPSTLAPSTPVLVEIATVAHADVVEVPAAAVVQEGPHSYVYVVTADRKAHRHEITAGIAASGVVEVRAGVNAGDSVVVEGQTGLPDEATVTTGPAATGTPD